MHWKIVNMQRKSVIVFTNFYRNRFRTRSVLRNVQMLKVPDYIKVTQMLSKKKKKIELLPF